MVITVQDAISAVQEVLLNKHDSPLRVTGETPLKDLDLDSLDLAEILIILESKYGAGTELNANAIASLERVHDLTRLLNIKPDCR